MGHRGAYVCKDITASALLYMQQCITKAADRIRHTCAAHVVRVQVRVQLRVETVFLRALKAHMQYLYKCKCMCHTIASACATSMRVRLRMHLVQMSVWRCGRGRPHADGRREALQGPSRVACHVPPWA